jgi:hypothetical protein
MKEEINGEINGETSEANLPVAFTPQEDTIRYWWHGEIDENHTVEFQFYSVGDQVGSVSWVTARKDGKPVNSEEEDVIEQMTAILQAFHQSREANPLKHKFGTEEAFIEILKRFPWTRGKFDEDLRREFRAYTNYKLGRGPNPNELSTKVVSYPLPGSQSVQAFVGLINQFGSVGTLDCEISVDPATKTAKYQKGQVTLEADYSEEVEQRHGYGASEEQSLEVIENELAANMMLDAEDALAGIYGLMRLVDTPDDSVILTVTELLKFDGKSKLKEYKKQTQIQKYEKIFRIIDRWYQYLPQTWRNPDTGKEENISIQGRMFMYEGHIISGQRAFPNMGTSNIVAFILRHSSSSSQLRENKRLLQIIQKPIETIAQIQSGQPSGDWAKAMGLKLLFQSRNNRKNMGGIVKLKRSTLLLTFRPKKNPEDTLGKNPNKQRGLTYWDTAISILKDAGIIDTIEEPPFPKTKNGKKKGQGWYEEWMNQVVTITMAEGLKQSLDEAKENYQKRSAKNPKKKTK